MINISGRSLCQCCFEDITSEPCPRCGFSEASYTPEVAVLPCGSVLQGRYAIGKAIGKGGFGITYLAYDIKLDRKIAIKEYFPRELAWRSSDTATVTIHSGKDAETFKNGAEKFYEEARLVAKFNGSSSIVNVYDFFYENATVYYSMEYLQGQTIKDRVSQGGTIPAEQVKFIAEEVASALMTTHGAKVLHRDVSPDNIMLCSDGKIKLIDFGAARQVVSEGSQNFSVILKPGFAPLEQYQKKGRQGPWTDIYSLGTSLYYCLTGKIPEDPMSRMENDETFAANLMSVDEGLRDIIRKATALRIEDRYGSANEMLNDLKNSSAAAAVPVNVPPVSNTINNNEANQPKQQPDVPKKEKHAAPKKEKHAAKTHEAAPTPAPASTPVPAAAPDTSVEVNAYGESAANKKPLVIAAIVGAIIVVFLIFLIVFLTRGGGEDSRTADATTRSSTRVKITEEVTEETTTTKKPAKTKAETTAAPTEKTTEKTKKTTKTKTETKAETSIPNEETASKTTTTTTVPETSTTPKTTTTTTKVTAAPQTTTTAVDPNSVKIGNEYYDKNKTGTLNLSGKNLTNKDIANLKYMTKIKELIISNNKLTDLSPVSGLTQLEKLTFHNNDVSDISFVKNLKKLKVFGAENNDISDISPLSGLTSLEEVWLQKNGISSISALSKCNKLKYVSLSDNLITDLTPLSGKEISELYASNNELNGSYEAIRGLKILDLLILEGNGYDADPDEFYMFTGYFIADDDGFQYAI